MLIAVIGESCVGKSYFAEKLKELLNAEVYTGKDYLRLAKNEAIAKTLFSKKLLEAVNGGPLIYVISEKQHLSLLPEGTICVLMTADLEIILERFANRLGGKLPAPLQQSLERKHGCFDTISSEYHIHNGEDVDILLNLLKEQK